MRGDAIKLVAASTLAGMEPTEREQRDAIGDAVDVALGIANDLGRIADALEKLVAERTGPLSF